MRPHDEHETTATAIEMEMLAESLDAGQGMKSLPRGLVRGLMRHAGYRVEMELETKPETGQETGKRKKGASSASRKRAAALRTPTALRT